MIGITLGDVTGIGPEVVVKALAKLSGRATPFLIIGDQASLESARSRFAPALRIEPFDRRRSPPLAFLPATETPLPPNCAQGAPEPARAAIAALEVAARLCLEGTLRAMVTAPVSKESIIRLGGRFEKFVGQTEFLSEIAGTQKTAMMLLGADDRDRWLRVALATTHVPIREVADQLTPEKIELAIELAAKACRDLRLPRARIGVCGLNPHAGEGGKMGAEEITIIAPAVQKMRANGVDAHGPFAADTLFYHAFNSAYDAAVAMYHDQGLVPLKMIGFERGVNWTLGLPFVRTSPDHGTAYDIAGKGIANESSMVAAIDLAVRLCGQSS